MTTLSDIVSILDSWYPPATAESWDSVGLVAGDPDAPVRKILLAVDPVQAVIDEAIEWGADLIVVHHPLLLKGITSMAATTPKGRVLHDLVSAGVALHTCHTNADIPVRGVSESMALALGLSDVSPLQPDTDALDAWTVYVPTSDVDTVATAMWHAGAGAIGDYDRASFRTEGSGTFRPLTGANPAIGQVGSDERVDETMLRMVAAPALRDQVRSAMIAAHPYEEVAHEITELVPAAVDRGHGRIGVLPVPMSLREFAQHVRRCLPDHGGATRVAGDLDRLIGTVAVCGGSGEFLMSAASSAGADVYVTSDLKHHPVSEHRERPGSCAIVDVPHWAAEWTWLPVVAADLVQALPGTVEVRVSTIVTDPWTLTLGTT